jgi:hypothetical protein
MFDFFNTTNFAECSPEDIVYDLGCGDGRIPIAAVSTFSAKKAVGCHFWYTFSYGNM